MSDVALARRSLLKSAALLNDSTTANDAVYSAVLLAATGLACDICGRILPKTIYTDELYRGNRTDKLWLTQFPVTAVSAVKIWDGANYTVEDSAHYELVSISENGARIGRFLRYPVPGDMTSTYPYWPGDYRPMASGYGAGGFGGLSSMSAAYIPEYNIKVSYTAGYDCTGWDSLDIDDAFAVPSSLEWVILQIAAWLIKRSAAANVDMIRQGPTMVKFNPITAGALPAELTGALSAYCKVDF